MNNLLDDLLAALRSFDEATRPGGWLGPLEQEKRAAAFGAALDRYIDARVQKALDERRGEWK
jgi:hypothetical protein